MQQNPSTGAIAFDIISPDNPFKMGKPLSFTPTHTFIGCGHLIRLSVLKKIGYYIPNPGYYGGEEKDLCIRMLDAEYVIMKYNGAYVWHDKTLIARDQPLQHRSGVCNDLIFCLRRTPFILLIPYVAYKLFSHTRFSIRYKKGILFKPCFQGFGDFFKAIFKGGILRKAVKI